MITSADINSFEKSNLKFTYKDDKKEYYYGCAADFISMFTLKSIFIVYISALLLIV